MKTLQNTKGSSKQKRIGKKVGNVVVIMLAITVVLAVAVCAWMFRSLVLTTLEAQCVSGTNVLAYELSRVRDDDDIEATLETLKNYMSMEFTICEGDVRAFTTVVQNGKRAVGTKMPSEISQIVIREGRSYVGRAEIAGEQHVCSYVPTRDESGKVTGAIFAGVSAHETDFQVEMVMLIAAAVSVLSIIVCILVLTKYLRKNVTIPLGEIAQVAERLEAGDLGLASNENITVSVRSNDEIGTLGRIFEDTIQRMRAYIGEISSVLGAIASGDLTSRVQQDYVGDFQSIKNSLEDIESRLNETMRQITESADQVASGSDQVSNSAQALAQGATEQASSVEELSATVSEISGNAQRTAQATREAGQFVDQAGAQLNISVGYVQQLNTAMAHISSSSEEISKIIAAIENIAFQTNILALNAAVEAARAGSAGKGFAVVADEVRNLATKSDEAAKATKELIESSINAVNEGTDVVNKVTESLGRTSQSAGGVTEKMAIVVQAVEDQTTALAQVTEGIDQISAVVQTNSATSEESAAASEELSSQASLLKQLMSSFRLNRNGRW